MSLRPLRERDDVTGRRSGSLVAVEFTGKVNRHSQRVWRFRCDCGREVLLAKTSVFKLNGARGQISCGCATWGETIIASDFDAPEFWKNTRPDGECLRWVGVADRRGYGRVSLRGKSRIAHRVAFALRNGEAPGNLYICHRCDHPWCVNPDHLFAGSARENIVDAALKGRLFRDGATPRIGYVVPTLSPEIETQPAGGTAAHTEWLITHAYDLQRAMRVLASKHREAVAAAHPAASYNQLVELTERLRAALVAVEKYTGSLSDKVHVASGVL